MLYWCGIREGELLALTAADFNFEKETVRINKFYQRLHGEDVITTPKTKKSNRMIKMPKFLCEEMQEYLQMLYGLKKKDRIFTVTKNIVEVYLNLLTSGRLNDYLAGIEEQAQKRFERIVEQMAESEGITEQLKATDQVAWVGEMNNIWSRAREVVNAELIYN
jgi:integrase